MLHGDIRVNGWTTASWSAVRKSPLASVDQVSTYRCTYTEHPNEGRPLQPQHHQLEFTLEHQYSDGAAALACAVIAEAHRQMSVPTAAGLAAAAGLGDPVEDPQLVAAQNSWRTW